MKHIRYQFLALLSVSALTFTSCDLIGSIDDMEPDHVVTDLNYITDAASAQTALNGVYASWRSTGVSYLRYGIASMAHTQAQAMVMGADEFAAENIETNNSNVETAYTAYYNVINAANTFLVHVNKNIPGLSEEKRTEMIAEARCQRALAYLTLLKCFGEYWKQDSQYGVCLFKDELVRDNQVRQRSSVAETYKLISEDLDYAIAHCEQHPADHYHMSSLFAKALKAKMYFAQDNYPEAARLSEEVINEAEAAGYELESDYANIFTEQFNSKEMLFAPYTANPNELMDASWFAFSPGSLLKRWLMIWFLMMKQVVISLFQIRERVGTLLFLIQVKAVMSYCLAMEMMAVSLSLVVMVEIFHSLQVKMMQLPTILFILGHTRVEA